MIGQWLLCDGLFLALISWVAGAVYVELGKPQRVLLLPSHIGLVAVSSLERCQSLSLVYLINPVLLLGGLGAERSRIEDDQQRGMILCDAIWAG